MFGSVTFAYKMYYLIQIFSPVNRINVVRENSLGQQTVKQSP